MKTLRLAKELALPLEAVTEKFCWLGRTGSGKTYGAMKLAELMLEADAQIGAIDPVGVWRGLRVPATKGGSSFEVVVFGGLYGDLPLEAHAGELIADLVTDRGLSFVLDVSQFIPSEQQRFVRAFADRFFHRKKSAPSAVHLFMEECQEFLPENPSGEEAKTLGVMQRLWKLGRNFGIGGSLISQRPQEVAKKALNMSGTMFAFQMTGPQERKAVKAWVADHGVATDIESVLQKLEVGAPHVESPMFLELSKTVHILPRVTADLSSTPKVGASTAAKRPLTPIDVKKLKASLAATIEKAKQEDPRELRQQIAALKRELADPRNSPAPSRPQPKVIEKFVLKDGQLARAEKLLERIDQVAEKYAGFEEDLRVTAKEIRDAIVKTNQPLAGRREEPTSRAVSPGVAPAPPSRGSGKPRPAPVPLATGAIADDPRLTAGGKLKKHVRAILTALAQHPEGRTREQVLILAGYSPSGDISTAFAGLLEHALIEQETNGVLVITGDGLELLGPYDPLPVGAELRGSLLNGSRLSSAEKKILGALFSFYPISQTRAAIHERAGLKPSGDTSTALSKFLKLGWAEEHAGGLVAADSFFPEAQ